MMNNNKTRLSKRIRQDFSRAAPDYDRLADLQNQAANELLQKVQWHLKPKRKFISSILDVGCGTGMMTSRLKDFFPNACVAGCDIALPMIKIAQGKTWGQTLALITADGIDLPFKTKSFDLVTSSLAYQWVANIEEAFSEAYRVLNGGGIFAFSTLTKGTLKELRECGRILNEKNSGSGLPPIMAFLDTMQIQSALQKIGFEILSTENKVQVKLHKGLIDLLKTIKAIGAGNPFTDGDKSLARGRALKHLSAIYKERFGTADAISATNCSLMAAETGLDQESVICATYEITSFVSSKKDQ